MKKIIFAIGMLLALSCHASVEIKSGASADLATVNPTAKAVRVIVYDGSGAEADLEYSESMHSLPVNIRQTAASVADVTVWTFRNNGATAIEVAQIFLTARFDGTATAASTPRYKLCRFTSATPTGGTAVVAIKHDTAKATPALTYDARFLDTGLTTTSVVFGTEFMVLGVPASATGGAESSILDLTSHPFILAPGDGLAIRVDTAMVIGTGLSGMIHIDVLP